MSQSLRAKGHYNHRYPNAHGLACIDPTYHWLNKFKKDACNLATLVHANVIDVQLRAVYNSLGIMAHTH